MPNDSDDGRRLTRRQLTRGAAALVGTTLASKEAPSVGAVGRAPSSPPASRNADCGRTSVGFTPLPDLKAGTYHGSPGGLYPNGANQPPAAYAAEGIARAAQVQPRNSSGQADAAGRTVLLSIGMSNTTQEFSAFQALASNRRVHPRLALVDGAQGGQDAELVKNARDAYWLVVDRRLELAGVAAPQVQAVWLKEAIAREGEPFPADSQRLQADLRVIVDLLAARFANLQLVYLASRTYGGYATTTLNPEPYAYESGFAVKWLIEQRIAAADGSPWLAWGPYLWTDGDVGRSDGFVWTCADVRASDGVHPSASGRQKVAALLWNFFTTDATATPWFLPPTA